MKTAELVGKQLDWAVAKAAGLYAPEPWISNPSTDWAQGGKIIERVGIDLYQVERNSPYGWEAEIQTAPRERARGKGQSPLVAAMRCYVKSVLGDEVTIPEGLV